MSAQLQPLTAFFLTHGAVTCSSAGQTYRITLRLQKIYRRLPAQKQGNLVIERDVALTVAQEANVCMLLTCIC